MEGHGEAMGFVADQLNQMQHRRMMIERNRILLLSVDIENLLALSDGGEWLVDNLERFQSLGGRVQLSESAVDEDETRHRLLFLLQTFITPRDYLAHRSKIVDAFDGADDELTVIRFLHLAVFPYHHRGHGLRALNVRDVEAFDSLGQFGQAERVLQLRLNGLGVGLEHTKTLIVRLFGIVAREID